MLLKLYSFSSFKIKVPISISGSLTSISVLKVLSSFVAVISTVVPGDDHDYGW